MYMHIVVLGGTNDKNGILSDCTKKRIEKCYEMLDNNNQNTVNVHFSGGFNKKFNSTNISHSNLCINYFNQINTSNNNINVKIHDKNNNTVDEAIHFGEYFANYVCCLDYLQLQDAYYDNDLNIKLITNDWHMNRVKYLFEKTFEYYNILNYEFISVKSDIEDEIFIENEKIKVKDLIQKPYGSWKEWLIKNYYDKFLHLRVARKNENDGKTIVTMRNENTDFFFNTKKFEWESFKSIYYSKYFSNEIDPFLIYLNDHVVGFIGCKTIQKNVNDIGIMFFKEFQNRGFGKVSLNKFLRMYDEKYNKEDEKKIIVSQILKSNIASYKIFLANHFELNENDTTDDIYYLTYQTNRRNIHKNYESKEE